nr:MAG TPA: hypothetical protein [Caudoviricetes sp.]
MFVKNIPIYLNDIRFSSVTCSQFYSFGRH